MLTPEQQQIQSVMRGRAENFPAGSRAPCQAHPSSVCWCSAGNRRGLLLRAAKQGCAEPRSSSGAVSGGKPKAHLQGAGERVCWLSSADIKACLCIAEDTCLGRKEAGACPGSVTGAAGRVKSGVWWFCLGLGHPNIKGRLLLLHCLPPHLSF